MIQHSQPLPADMPTCVEGHRPQLVQSRGALPGHRIGTPCPPHWHIECFQCAVATVPSPSRALTESRWRGDPHANRIPLSEIGRVRHRLAEASYAA